VLLGERRAGLRRYDYIVELRRLRADLPERDHLLCRAAMLQRNILLHP
jgi:hypothetical protein